MSSRESERAEQHKTIWRIANDLRGSVDGWDFKSYVLGMLFYRFISENLAAYLNDEAHRAGEKDFDYAALSDAHAEQGRCETVKEKGFYILPSHLFANVSKRARSDANLNETLSRVFKDIEGSATGSDSEDDFKGLFDDLDVNSSKLGPTVAKRNEKLVKLLDAIGDLPLANNRQDGSNGFADNSTLFIDASACFVRSGNKNKLTDASQQKVLDAFTARTDVAHFARLVENGELAANGYNIAVSSYVEQEDTREAVGILTLNAEIGRIVARQAELREQIDAIVADLEGDIA